MTTALSIYRGLPQEDRTKFISDITDLGLVNELNNKRFRRHLKDLVAGNRGGLKQLYRRVLTAHDSGADCDMFFTALTNPDEVLGLHRKRIELHKSIQTSTVRPVKDVPIFTSM